MKATFFERLGAYLIDMIIVSFIFSFICLGFGSSVSKTEEKMQELDNMLIENKITPEEYLEEYTIVLYDYQKENILQSAISLSLTIAYYVIFQYMNKGQTIGKKILNIKVVDQNTNKPISIIKGLLRSLIVFSIVSSSLNIAFLYIFNANNYLYSYLTLLALEGIFTLITAIFILYRKDRRGLHDMISNTIVIKESR